MKDEHIDGMAYAFAKAAYNFRACTSARSSPGGWELSESYEKTILKCIRDCYEIVPSDQMEKRFPIIHKELETFKKVEWRTQIYL